MTPLERIGYLANLERCKAQDRIHTGNYDPADYQGVYALWLEAHGREDLARKAQSRAAEVYADREIAKAKR